MNGRKVYDIVSSEIEKYRQDQFNKGNTFYPEYHKIYLGKKIKLILKNWNNKKLNQNVEYTTIQGIPIIEKPESGCIMIKDTLIE